MKILYLTDTYAEKREYCFNGILGLFSKNTQVSVQAHPELGLRRQDVPPNTDNLNNLDIVCTNLLVTAKQFPG